MPRYEVHGATSKNLPELLDLARYLNTVNLPASRAHIAHLLDHSSQSFAGELPTPERKFVFVLRDVERGRAVGTSTLVAKLGRRDAPYIYLDVIREEKYSRRLDRHFRHKLLRIGFSYDGPTELAGLVVDPEYRRAPERLGLVISCVRFLYLAMHRPLFQDQLLAELLPPLEPDGTSHLWEAFGRRYTHLDYAEADLLSSEDKTFIRDLFPNGVVHASLFSPEAQNVIGKVGQQTQGVEKLLKRVGFRYADRIDPFDGGPHFVADTSEVTLVKSSRRVRVAGNLDTGAPDTGLLVGRDLQDPPYFRAVLAPQSRLTEAGIELPESVLQHLGATRGDEVFTLPLAERRPRSAAPGPGLSRRSWLGVRRPSSRYSSVRMQPGSGVGTGVIAMLASGTASKYPASN